MRRVVGALTNRDYASALFAFTSLDVFVITFQPAYFLGFDSGSVALAYDSRTQLFEVTFQGTLKHDRAKWRCEEFEVCRLIDALVLRMKFVKTGELGRRIAGDLRPDCLCWRLLSDV
jgi:hypothetical protein